MNIQTNFNDHNKKKINKIQKNDSKKSNLKSKFYRIYKYLDIVEKNSGHKTTILHLNKLRMINFSINLS